MRTKQELGAAIRRERKTRGNVAGTSTMFPASTCTQLMDPDTVTASIIAMADRWCARAR